ncbi:MAG: lactate racemase domain-containing protein [Deltaproteobacteria bacterium]
MPTNGLFHLSPFKILERTSPSVPAVSRLEETIHQSLSGLALDAGRLRGKRIAVSCGSRGIANLSDIVRAICGWLKSQGAQPFVFPAMGSHGGGTAEGQQSLLTEYGVTEKQIGAPVVSAMETVVVGTTPEGIRSYMDANAWRADGVIVMNRVKPHTDFSGIIESGLLKMIAIGMGKEDGARETHRWGRKFGPERVIREASALALASGKILAGLAVSENEFHQIAIVRAARPEDLVRTEEAQLVEAKRLVPRPPFENLHVLVVDEMGKNISGTGMDTKVIGRGASFPSHDRTDLRLIYTRDLTDASDGNALGVGLADVIHDRLFRKIDFQKTYLNVRTSLNPPMAQTPMHFPSDQAALDFTLGAIGSPGRDDQRVVWIRNTLNLNRIAISRALAREAAGLGGWRLSDGEATPQFNAAGDTASPLANT